MEYQTMIAFTIVALVMLVALAAYFFRNHSRFSGIVRGPGNTSAQIKADGRPGDATIRDAVSREGSITASSKAGGNAIIENSKSKGDITAETSVPRDE